MATDPEDAILTHISGNVGSWVEDTNLFRGKVRPRSDYIPQQSAFVSLTGGPEPINFAPNAGTLQEYEHAVQIIIRGESEQYGATRALADAIYDYLHDNPPAGWFRCRCQSGRAFWVDKDEHGGDIFVVNLRMGILE